MGSTLSPKCPVREGVTVGDAGARSEFPTPAGVNDPFWGGRGGGGSGGDRAHDDAAQDANDVVQGWAGVGAAPGVDDVVDRADNG